MLGLAGLLIHFVTDGRGADLHDGWRAALAAFLFFGTLSAAFTVEEDRWTEPAAFSLGAGVVMAGLAWRAVSAGDALPDPAYGFAAGVLALLLALPLFQAGFFRRRLATPYAETHYHVWTDAIGGAGALAFTGLAWLVLLILSELFHLLKIDLLRQLMDRGWFGWTFSGLAFGAALGTLRNQARVLGTLQSVVMLVLSLLALPVAAGLAIFLLATAVSGPEVLWQATRSATPVLLMCAAGAFVLVNAIVRGEDAAMSGSRVMRLAAYALTIVLFPLAAFAAVSMGLRLAQYGLAPERLWGLTAIIVACAWGLGYWGALLRGWRGNWAAKLREANFHLALGTCALALLLALPVLDFGALSTRNQLARLRSGAVSAEDFDYAALRWDFGAAGRKALEGLAKGGGKPAEYASAALAQKTRPYGQPIRPDSKIDLRVQPEDPALRRLVLAYLRTEPWQCPERCVALDLGAGPNGTRRIALVSGGGFQQLTLGEGGTSAAPPRAAGPALKPDSTVEIRTLEKRYIFVDGKPMDRPLD